MDRPTKDTSVLINLNINQNRFSIRKRENKNTDEPDKKKAAENLKKSKKGGKVRYRSSKKKPSTVRRCLGPFYDFFYAEPEHYRAWKMFLGFPFGGLFGYGLYWLVIKPMDLSEDSRHLAGGVLVFGVASGFAITAGVRCVCFLLLPTFMGKTGRSYIGTFAIGFLISGPIENLVTNAQDITRSLTCAAELAANHTQVKWKFRLMPIGNVLRDMQEEGYLLNRIGHRVNKAFTPIKTEIRGEEGVAEMEARTIETDKQQGSKIDRAAKVEADTKEQPNDDDANRLTNKYKKKAEFECEDVYNRGVRKCRGVFDGLYNKCKDKLPPVVDLLCKVVKLGFLCDLVKIIGKALGGECDTRMIVNSGFGRMYKSSEDSVGNMDKGMKVAVEYKVVQTQEDIDYTSVEQMRSSTMHDFKQGRKMLEFIFIIIKRLLGLTFLFVVFGANKYYKKYSTDMRFDNIYITSYFRKIDARRKMKRKKILLPLKKIEKGAVIFPSSLKLMKSERQKLGKGTFLILARAALSGMVFFMAFVLYKVMDIIREHSRVDFRQTGTNYIDIKIGGTGFMSNIVRLFMNGLNSKNDLEHISSNLDCLPQPVEVDSVYYWRVFGTYFLVWVLILLDAYGLRLRRVIAAFFFRKREKQRVLHMYNSMMKKRKFFLRDMRRKVKKKAKTLKLASTSGLLYSLTRQFPDLCSCLTVFGLGKAKCLICEEPKSKRNRFKKCRTRGCNFVYCMECWFDVKRKCYACLPAEEFSSTDTEDGFSSSSD